MDDHESSALIATLCRELGDAVVVDPDILEAHRRDQAGLVTAGVPSALVRAASTADVQTTMRCAHRHRVPVVARGAGSGLAGGANAIDGCLMLSLTRMNAIVEIDRSAMVAVVEPGVINGDVKTAVAEHGLWYCPDPASFEFSTIGGNIATNAGGLCCVKYGVTRESVLGLEVVLADGSIVRTGGKSRKSVAGYDLTGLFVGSEGTLGVVTQATLKLRPKPAPQRVLVAFFDSVAAIGAAAVEIGRTLTPALLEFMDRATLLAVENWKPMQLDTSAAALLVAGTDLAGVGGDLELESMAAACERSGATFVAQATDAAESEMLLTARRLAYPALEQIGATLLDDVAVPIDAIAGMLDTVAAIARRRDVVIGTFGHAGDGNLHPTIVFDSGDELSVAAARSAFHDIVDAAVAVGGTITGEHGVGLLKAGRLTDEIGDAGVDLHHRIKRAFDPDDICNPGKVVPARR